MSRWSVVCLFVIACAAAGTPAAAAVRDYADEALNIIPSSQYGDVPAPPQASRQAEMYDALTPLFDRVGPRDLRRYFKSERFGVAGRVARRERPRPGLTIERDSFNVPHITGETRTDVAFGAGYALAQDRGALIEQARYVARLSAIDAPGVNAFQLLQDLRQFEPTAQTEAEVAKQTRVLRSLGDEGTAMLRDIDAYVAGINAAYRKTGNPAAPWKRIDVYAINAIGGFIFGRGGGDETRRSMMLSGLQQRLGDGPGLSVFNDLREREDPEAVVTMSRPAPYERATQDRSANEVVDDGSFQPAGGSGYKPPPKPHASNFLILGADRSATGHPLFVGGPQVGYFYPGLTLEMELQGGGFSTRGVGSALGPYVFIGRGPDYAWSLTSAGSDVIDQYVEELCGGSDAKYVYKGRCRDMGVFNAGVLKGGEGGDRQIAFSTTVHGPVVGYATVGGRRVAISSKRSSYGRDILWQAPFQRMSRAKPRNARQFLEAFYDSPFTFNVGYADDRDIAMITAGRLPVRPRGVDNGLPTKGTGRHEWTGFVGGEDLPQQIGGPEDTLINWNNKPAKQFAAADDEWSYGSRQRVLMLREGIAERRRHTLASVTSAMNAAATTDFRITQMLPTIAQVLDSGPAPSERAAQMLALMQQWRAQGASRLDRDDDGSVDDPGAAIIDEVYPRWADAVMQPVIGPQLAQLNTLINRNASTENDFFSGWNSYIDKDLRSLLGRRVRGPYANRYCGAGDLDACRASLWAAVEQAGEVLAARLGPDPSQWRASATAERISFVPGVLPTTIRYTNRPSGIQQVISFDGHRGG